MLKLFCILYLSLVSLFGLVQTSFAVTEQQEIKCAWLTEYEAFPAWYASKTGMDSKLGYKLINSYYPSGSKLVSDIYLNKWTFAGVGIVPALQAIMKEEAEIIAIGSDETEGNEILARTDSTVFDTLGFNPSFPEVYGSPEDIRGKTILCPLSTNSHQLLYTWLQLFGLDESDVIILNTNPDEIIETFHAGLGDFAILWSPNTRKAKKLDFQTVATAKQCNLTLQTVILENNASSQPSSIATKSFLNIYLASVEEIQNMDLTVKANLYNEFLKETATIEFTMIDAERVINNHKLYNTKEQQDTILRRNSTFYTALDNAIDFYSSINMLSRREVDLLKKADYINIE